MKNIVQYTKTITPYFHFSITAREWIRKNMGFLVFKYTIGNNDFIKLLGSTNLNVMPGMMFTTHYCAKSSENVLGGSVPHISLREH